LPLPIVRDDDECRRSQSSRVTTDAPFSTVDRFERQPRMGSMALNELGKMLTAAEVAEMLHLHVNTVKRLGDRGELKYYRVCKRGDRRFLLEDVRRFLDQNR
jgi:excisionase family DNA binding protein